MIIKQQHKKNIVIGVSLLILSIININNVSYGQFNCWGSYYVTYSHIGDENVDTIGILNIDSTRQYYFKRLSSKINFDSEYNPVFMVDTLGQFELTYIEGNSGVINFLYDEKEKSFREHFRSEFGLRQDSSTCYISYLGTRLGRWYFTKQN